MNAEEFTATLRAKGYGQAELDTINRWLARGDGAAVYENHDLGHPMAGHIQVASYGSDAAQLETDDPPERLPDIGHQINWRYMLIGTYRGDPVTL